MWNSHIECSKYRANRVSTKTPADSVPVKSQLRYSMLMFIRPSFVSFMPCMPTRFPNGPEPFALLPLLALSTELWIDPSLFALICHQPPSLCAGDGGRIGLFWRLRPGETALRLNMFGSKSSSLLRLPSVLRVTSLAVGIGCGVDERLGEEFLVLGQYWALPCTAEEAGVSTFMSSLIVDELPRGNMRGGGVRILSSKEFQNSGPPEFFRACVVKLDEARRSVEVSPPIISVRSSKLSVGPAVAAASDGDEAAVPGCEGTVLDS